MAAANDATVITCTNNSDYAVICSFFEHFGDKSGLLFPSFHDLQQMLENAEEVSYPLIELHVKLMRKLKKSVSFDRWEKAAAKYAHSYSDQDGWEIERFGYKKISLGVKLRLLKNLLEAQFDGNVKFKNEINKVTSDELRLQPLGKDIQGRRYWHLLDDDCNLRVYREDLDEETWVLVSSDRESMLKLIEQLSTGKQITEEEGASPATSEESGANGQDECVKLESKDKVQQSTDGPSETKRLKVEPTETPVAPEPEPQPEAIVSEAIVSEAIVSEAIESPVLLVKGEGNGADCETGNPGEGKTEESCGSRDLTNKEDKADDSSVVECASDRLIPDVDSSESSVVLEPNATRSSSVLDSACRQQTSSPARLDLKETPRLQENSEPSVETKSVSEPPVSENENRTVPNPSEENHSQTVADGLSPSRDPPSHSHDSSPTPMAVASDIAVDSKTDSHHSPRESSIEEETLASDPSTEVTSLEISIDKPSTNSDGHPKNVECPDNTVLHVPSDDQDSSVVSSKIAEQVESSVPKLTSENELSLAHNQELPKSEIVYPSPDPVTDVVKVDPLPSESSTAVLNSCYSSDQIQTDSIDQSRSSADSNIPANNVVSPHVEIPVELEETKAIVEPVPEVPSCAPVVEEKPSGSEESQTEQTTAPEVKDNDESLDVPKVEESPQVVAQLEDKQSSLTPHESPKQAEIISEEKIELAVTDVDVSNTCEKVAKPTAEPENISEVTTDEESSVRNSKNTMQPSQLSPSVPGSEAVAGNSVESTQEDTPVVTDSCEAVDPVSISHETAVDCQETPVTETESHELIAENSPTSCPIVKNDSTNLSHESLGKRVSFVERTPVPENTSVSRTFDTPTEVSCISAEVDAEKVRNEAVAEKLTCSESASTVSEVRKVEVEDKIDAEFSEVTEQVAVAPETIAHQSTEKESKTAENEENPLVKEETSSVHHEECPPKNDSVITKLEVKNEPRMNEEVSAISLKEEPETRDGIQPVSPKDEPPTMDRIPGFVQEDKHAKPDIQQKTLQTMPVENDEVVVEPLQSKTADHVFNAEPQEILTNSDSIKECTESKSLAEPEENGVDQMPTDQTKPTPTAHLLKEEVINPPTAHVTELCGSSEIIPSKKAEEIVALSQTIKPNPADQINEIVSSNKIDETTPLVDIDKPIQSTKVVEIIPQNQICAVTPSIEIDEPTPSIKIDDETTPPVKMNEASSLVTADEITPSNKVNDLIPSESKETVEALAEVDNKPPELVEAEKSTDLTKLTFDFDASAPAVIVLPPRSRAVDNAAKRRGRKRGRQMGDDATDSGKENDSIQRQPTVLRQSSRIAKLREKEDEERRKQEADRLQRLKEEHERREKRRTTRDERMKKLEEKQQRRQQQKTTPREDVVYDEESEDESSSSEDEGPKKRKKKDKRRHRKKKINDRPWDSTESSEKSSESEEDGLEELQVEEENEELVFKSDHEFSPESDLDGEPEVVQPTKHARTARAGTIPKKRSRSKKVKVEKVEEEDAPVTEEEEEVEEEEEEEEEKEANCTKCGQSDHPEWILLCDRCDAGWHANCVKPPLMVIPEGEWFCPPCDHTTLLERLQERLEAYEFLLKEKEAELIRRKEQELEAKIAREEAEKQALQEMEEEAQEDDDEDEGNSNAGDHLGADGEDVEEEETSEESGDEEDDDEAEDSQAESDENLNKRRQRKAAQQANYSFKDFDDMIKSALRDDGEEEEEEGGKGKGKGKGPRSGLDDKSDEDDDKPRSPPGVRPSGVGNKRISTSDDDSDIMPQVIRKKKARKLNDLSASSNEDDSDEDFQGSSAEASDSEDEDEEASDSGDSFVVDDDSDDDDVIHVSAKRKARAASPTIRRSARSARKRNVRMDSSDTSEDESEYEVASKRKRGNESWDSSGESSSDASWGRSKKRKSAPKGRAKPTPPPPKPKPKPSPRKAPANRGRGRGGRANKVESDDEPFRSNVSVKKIKEARPVTQEDEDSDHAQRRTTRGRQISYKELISSGESQDEGGSTVKKMGTLFAADRNKSNAGAGARGAASRRGRGGATTPASSTAGRGSQSGGDNTPVPVSVISARVASALSQDDESRFSGSTDTLEFSSAAAAAAAAAASVYTTGDESHTSNDVLPPTIDPELATLPIVLPHEDVTIPLVKEDLPPSVLTPVLSQDLQVSRLIQQRPAEVPAASLLPADLQINRLINSQTISSSSSNSPARQSPGMVAQPRLVRDVLDSQTPPPAVQLSAIPAIPAVVTAPSQPAVIATSSDLPLYSHGGVIKQTRHSLPPTPPLYSGPHVVKATDLVASATPPSVIRPYPTTATSSALSTNLGGSNPANPLSIQGLLGTGHSSPGPVSSAPPPPPPPSHAGSHIRPYGNTSHMIGHGPFLNHTPYASPYSAVPPSRTSYMGTPVTPTPRPAYPPIYPSAHIPPHGLPLHSPYQHHGPPLRPTSSYQHAGFPQAFAAAAAAAANAEEERRIYRVAQASREAGADNFDPATAPGILMKSGVDDPLPASAVPPESEFGGLVSYFSSQQEDFEES